MAGSLPGAWRVSVHRFRSPVDAEFFLGALAKTTWPLAPPHWEGENPGLTCERLAPGGSSRYGGHIPVLTSRLQVDEELRREREREREREADREREKERERGCPMGMA